MKPVFESRIIFNKPDRWIVWYNHRCTVFNNQTRAMDFIYKCRYDNPNVYFNGWITSFNGNNLVAVLKSEIDYDPNLAENYLVQNYMAPTGYLVPTKYENIGSDTNA